MRTPRLSESMRQCSLAITRSRRTSELTTVFSKKLLALTLLIGLCLAAVPHSAFAQSDTLADSELSNYGVSCTDGKCSLSVDIGPIDAQVPVPSTAPIRLALPGGERNTFAGASIEVADGLTLSLPAGDIRMDTGNLTVGVDNAGEVQQIQGTATAMLPSLTLPNNVHIGGKFPAQFGYDAGANLGNISHLLSPDQQYLYLRLGDGFALDTTLTDEQGNRTPITLSVPENETATFVIDPENQLLYLDGRFNISQVLRLAVVGASMGIDVGQLPMLSGLAIPLESTVGLAALFSRDPARNFVEVSGDLAVDGGPLGRLLQLEDNPLVLDSAIRIDRSGMKLQGTVDANLAPRTLLESGGNVEFFVPFERLRDTYLRIGGDLSVPILGLAAENETILQRHPDGGLVNTDLPWWDEARGWIGSAAGSAAGKVAGGAQMGIGAVQSAVDAAHNRDKNAEPSGTDASAGRTTPDTSNPSGLNCGLNRAQQLLCQTTGLCEAPEDACLPTSGD